ncbi:MAG: hypothetical protein WC308_00340 [archaeon]|jgi:hypothetical protein
MRGLFSFSITLAMLAILLSLSISGNNFYSKLEKGKSALIEMEISSKERTLMENNTDKIIEKKLEEQIAKRNMKPELAKDEINSALTNYLAERAEESTIFGETISKTTGKEFLNETSNAFVIETSVGGYGEYSFSSNLQKNTIISKSFGKNSTTKFTIPIGYTMRLVKN